MAAAAATANLSVVELAVTEREVSMSVYDHSRNTTDTMSFQGAAVEITLRNTGGQEALVDRVDVTVERAWAMAGCDGGGALEASVTYDLRLADGDFTRPTPFALPPKDEDFVVAPTSHDKLALAIGPESVGEMGWSPISAVRVGLHERSGRTLPAGRAVLMDSGSVDQIVASVQRPATSSAPDPRACHEQHLTAIDAAAALPGEKSAALLDLGRRLHAVLDGRPPAPTTPAPSPTVTRSVPAPVAPSGGRHDGTPEPTGGWIAVLASIPAATAAHDVEVVRGDYQVRTRVPVYTLRSDDFASLRPGYWVLYHGPTRTSAEALEVCAYLGLTDGSSCAGRYLSQDTADRALICTPATRPTSPACHKN